MSRAYSTSVKETAVSLSRQGLLDSEIAERFGTSRPTILRWRREAGIDVSPKFYEQSREKQKKLQAIRREVKSRRAASRGWPVVLPPYCYRILESLCDNGPQTRKTLTNGRFSNTGRSGPDVMTLLIRHGLVISVSRMCNGWNLYFPTMKALALRQKFLRQECSNDG